MATATATRRLLTSIRRDLERLKAERKDNPLLKRLRADPATLLALAGMPPDPWQAGVLRSATSRILLLCSRQSGKSATAAALALREALFNPPALVLLLSPTQRQSGELFREHFRRLYDRLGRPVPATQETALTLALANGSRVVALPGEEGTVRCYSGVKLLVIDEAARVPDALYYSVRPMLSVSRGKLVCLSTPFGRRGFFHESWTGDEDWHRVKIVAGQCPRISPEFLAEERAVLGLKWYRQEYECSFEDLAGAVFTHEQIAAMFSSDIKAVPPHWLPESWR
jgi:hypothetical protein